MDLLDGTMQMDTGLIMYIHHHRPYLGSLGDITLGGVDHIMYIEGFPTGFGHCLDDREAKGDVRNKRAVHDIEVKPVGLTLVDHVDLAV